ncbi:MAG TPA: cytochrome c [Acetobacteraceae bacterium]|nr:cytochrome c [Acetobacteraceae bacterium]
MARMTTLTVLGLMLAAAALAALPQAMAADDSVDVIAVRKAGQDLVLGNFTGMSVAAKNDVKDVKPFAAAAQALVNWEKQFLQLFPPGSDKGETRALPAVWSDRDGFLKAGQNLIDAAEKLAATAKANDTAAFADQIKVVGQACNNCHDKFRRK